MSKSEIPKNLKNNFGSKKNWGNFSTRLSNHYSFLELWMKMTLGLSISRTVLVLFLIFTQIMDYHPHSYGDMAITEKPETVETQE